MRTPLTLSLLALLTLSAVPSANADQPIRPPSSGEGQAASLLLYIDPVSCPDPAAPCFGYEPAVDHKGRSLGRWVPLNGDIDGLNFEPGVCAPGVLNQFFPDGTPNPLNGSVCVAFGDGVEPGTFRRALPGDVAFTQCNCTVGGRGDRDIPDFPLVIDNDVLATTLVQYQRLQRKVEARRIESSFTLRIKYFAPDADFPFGHTEFFMFAGRGRLHGLLGSGILDFAGAPPITFDYFFWPW